MSIPTAQDPVQFYTATGTSGVFAFSGTVFDADALTVFALNPATGVVSAPEFSVVLADDYSGATVTVAEGLANGYGVAVARVPIRRQAADLGYQNRTPERQLDRVAQDLTALNGMLARSIRGPLVENVTFAELPVAADRAGQVLGFDDDGNPTLLANVPVSPEITLGTIWQTALLTASASLARAALGAVGAADSPSISGTFDFTGGRIKMPTRTAGDSGTDGASTAFVQAALLPLVRGQLAGLTLSNDGVSPDTVLGIAAGVAADSTAAKMMTLASAFTKTITAQWSAGTGQGGLGGGLTATANTWYHVFLISHPTAAGDIYFDSDLNAGNKPVGTTGFRRIGSFLLDGSTHIVRFLQDGDFFQWMVGVLDIADTNPGTSEQTKTLTVPPGVNVIARLNLFPTWGTSGSGKVHVRDPGITTQSPADNAAPLAVGVGTSASNGYGSAGQIDVRTNTSKQIIYKLSNSGASDVIRMALLGWFDKRGRGE